METNRAALIFAQAAASDGRFLRLHEAARRVFGGTRRSFCNTANRRRRTTV